MRYGLLALSVVMLTGGGFAAQSAMAITKSAAVASAHDAPKSPTRTMRLASLRLAGR